jgi:flagellar biosynthesis/type III secretory pathway chaperone
MTANDRMKDLIGLARRLGDLLARENEALRKSERVPVAEQLAEKTTLSRAYEVQVAGLIGEPEEMAKIDPGLRTQYRKAAEHLREAARENDTLLKAAIGSGRRVMEVIAEAVKRSEPTVNTYGRNGVVKRKSLRAPQSLPLSLNQSL